MVGVRGTSAVPESTPDTVEGVSPTRRLRVAVAALAAGLTLVGCAPEEPAAPGPGSRGRVTSR